MCFGEIPRISPFGERTIYDEIAEYLTEIERLGSLCVCRICQNFNLDEVAYDDPINIYNPL